MISNVAWYEVFLCSTEWTPHFPQWHWPLNPKTDETPLILYFQMSCIRIFMPQFFSLHTLSLFRTERHPSPYDKKNAWGICNKWKSYYFFNNQFLRSKLNTCCKHDFILLYSNTFNITLHCYQNWNTCDSAVYSSLVAQVLVCEIKI